ncbi:MAG: PDZ domain-containing protein, partial [Planctomycetota bacterium]
LLNVAGMQQVASYLVELAARAADAESLPAFRAASRNERPATQRTREAPLAALPPRLGATWRHIATEDPPYVEIQSVIPGSAAAAAGLVEGDRVVRIDGLPLVRRGLFPAVVWRATDEVALTIWPVDGTPQREVRVAPSGKPVRLGVAWRRDVAEPSSVLVTRVAPLSPADRAGIGVHDRLLGLDGEPIGTEGVLLARIREKLAAGAEQLLFDVESSGRIRTVQVDLRLPIEPPEDAEL